MAKKPKKEIESCSVREYRNVSELNLHPDNPREISRERLNDLKESIIKKGFYEPILIWGENNYVLSGNHRLVAIRELIAEGWKINGGSLSPVNQLPVVECDCDEATAIAILFETNNRYANWIEEKVREALNAADSSELKGYGFSSAELDIWIAKAEDEARDTMSAIYDDDSSEYDLPDERPAPDAKHEKLSDKFGIPPFSVFNAREGWWQDRKRAWIGIGIKSELGRGGAPGGSPRPATDYAKTHARGDGVGRAL